MIALSKPHELFRQKPVAYSSLFVVWLKSFKVVCFSFITRSHMCDMNAKLWHNLAELMWLVTLSCDVNKYGTKI